MKQFLVVIILSACFLGGCTQSPSRPPHQLHGNIHPVPRTTTPSRVGPIGADPFACTVNADVAIEANSATACTFTLPPVPVTYTLHCNIIFEATAGTSGLFSINVVPSAAPITATNFSAIITSLYTPPVSIQITPVTAVGDQPITFASIPTLGGLGVPANLQLDGTWPASGAAQTFLVAIEADTGVAGTIMVGSSCRMAP